MKQTVTLLFLTLLLFCSCKRDKGIASGWSDTLPVEVLVVDGGTAATERNYVGAIGSEREVTLTFMLGGTLTQVAVHNGQHVAEGQLLAEVDATTARSMHAAAQATLRQAEDAYRRLEAVHREVTLMAHGASGSVTAAQPLYAGGRIVTGNRLARLGIEAAELQADMKARDVIENIESTYYLVTGLQQKVATIDAALALIDSLDRTVQSALANGLVTRADALQLQLKRNEMTAKRQQLASGIRLSKRLLCRQIGLAYSDSLAFADPAAVSQPPLAYCYDPQGDSLRPEMRLLQLGVEAEQLRRRLTLGETLPQLTLMGTAYYGDIIKEDPAGNAVALLSL